MVPLIFVVCLGVLGVVHDHRALKSHVISM